MKPERSVKNERVKMLKMLSVICMSLLSLLLQSPPACGAGRSASQAEVSQLPPLLISVRQNTQKALDEMDRSLAASAKELARTGLDSPDARSVLSRVCPKPDAPFVLDCCTVSPEGRMLLVEPAAYKSSEGSDISGQEQIVRLHATKKPVMSRTITMVEGFDAVDLERPVLSGSGELLGSVSLLIKSESLFAVLIPPVIEGYPVNVWVMETGGRILFDAHEGEIGKNLLQDPAYAPFEELRKLAARIAAEPSGTGVYAYYQGSSGSPVVNKRASWSTVGLHGSQWRIVLVQKIAEDQVVSSQAPAPSRILDRIGELCADADLQETLAARDKKTGLAIFKKFYQANPGLYSVQWVDAKGKNRFGYPKENSLKNYSLRKDKSTDDQPFLAAIAAGKPATVEQPLGEGGVGVFFLHPIYSGEKYLGMVYAIHKKQ